jgi:ubiquinone/menaquinone biosynthesis C-methylase UbiE
MSAPRKDQYFMEDVRESDRLRSKVDGPIWVSKYLNPWVPDAGRVLEVGCGPGALASAAARARPNVNVIGIDISEERFAKTPCRANLTFQQANAHTLPFSSDSFDLVYSRFLLEYLADKPAVVEEMRRVCRPGGRLLIQDLDGQLLWHFPEDVDLQAGINKVIAGLRVRGFDPFVGRQLFSLLKATRLEDIRITAESYHLYAGTIDPENLRLWETKLDIVLPVAADILGSAEEAMSLKERFLEYLRRDDTLTYSVVFTAVGTKAA